MASGVPSGGGATGSTPDEIGCEPMALPCPGRRCSIDALHYRAYRHERASFGVGSPPLRGSWRGAGNASRRTSLASIAVLAPRRPSSWWPRVIVLLWTRHRCPVTPGWSGTFVNPRGERWPVEACHEHVGDVHSRCRRAAAHNDRTVRTRARNTSAGRRGASWRNGGGTTDTRRRCRQDRQAPR